MEYFLTPTYAVIVLVLVKPLNDAADSASSNALTHGY